MPTEVEVINQLKQVVDPHTDTSVYDMGLISELKVTDGTVSLTFRPTSPFCPLAVQLAVNMKRRLKDLKGARKVDVKVVGHVQEQMINKALAET